MDNESSKLKEAFLSEADAHVKAMNTALVELEKSPGDKKIFHDFFRGIHTLKSLAATMNYHEIMDLCHTVEDLLVAIKNKTVQITKISDILFDSLDYMSADLKVLEENKPELPSKNLIDQLKNLLDYGAVPAKEFKQVYSSVEGTTHEKIQAIEVKVDRLDMLMNLAEALLVNKMKFDLIREQVDHPELTPAIESLGRLITDLQYYVLQVSCHK